VAHKSLGAELDLRAQLLKWRKGFRREVCSRLAENADWSSQAWEQLPHSVDALSNGEAYRFHAWELPDDHPARVLGVNVDFCSAPTTCYAPRPDHATHRGSIQLASSGAGVRNGANTSKPSGIAASASTR
jgi:hypothetical protein